MNDKNELSLADKVNLLMTLMRAFTFCFLPFLRYRFGANAFGLSGIVAFIIQVIYIEATHDVWMVRQLGMWLLLVLLQRIACDRTAHSFFEGNLITRIVMPSIGTDATVRIVEAGIVLMMGVLMTAESANLANFWMCGGVTLLFSYRLDLFAVSRRIQKMQDQEMEMRFLHEQYQRTKGAE